MSPQKDQWGKKNSMYRHGKFGTRVHKIWDGMVQRCHNENSRDYPNWGGRGIRVCDRWREFVNFYEDMGDPLDGWSLDRIDNNGPYSKSNCRWATWKTQHNNKRNNRFLVFQNQKMTVSQWATITGLTKATLEWRLNNGWSVERALTERPNTYGKEKSKEVVQAIRKAQQENSLAEKSEKEQPASWRRCPDCIGSGDHRSPAS